MSKIFNFTIEMTIDVEKYNMQSNDPEELVVKLANAILLHQPESLNVYAKEGETKE